jgi:dihydropteroate synthase
LLLFVCTFRWQIRGRVLEIRRPLVMGIVNVTPDSFSDGGQFFSTDAAVAHGLQLVQEGADLLDIGGESTRPGSQPVPLDEELRRVLPVVQALVRQTAVPLSIDTAKTEVARQALTAGAQIVNDVTALQGDAGMPEVVRASGAGVILMHMQGTPATMQIQPQYTDVVGEVYAFLEARLRDLQQAGIAFEQMATDPGIGFGKTGAHNLALLANLARFQNLKRPLCLGVSRKGIIGRISGQPVEQRLAGSLAVVCHAAIHDAVQIVRVHDVRATRDALMALEALRLAPPVQEDL